MILCWMSPGCRHKAADAAEYIWSVVRRSFHEAGTGRAVPFSIYTKKLYLIDVFYVHTLHGVQGVYKTKSAAT